MSNKGILELIPDWQRMFEKRRKDFNILDSIHLSENDHSNILRDILLQKVNGRRVFLEKFIFEILGIIDFANPDRSRSKCTYNELVVKTQVPADGQTGTGFIDLVIEGEKNNKKKVIVVENKICNAVDTPNQLTRYWNTYSKQKYETIYIVYLTEDGSKEPSAESVTSETLNEWRNNNIYRAITAGDLLDWMKDYVLINCTYGKTGLSINSILLYYDYLSGLVGNNVGYTTEQLQMIEKHLQLDGKSAAQRFNTLNNVAKVLDESIENQTKESPEYHVGAATDLCNCLKWACRHIFKIPEGWSVNCTPTYITIFPTDWQDRFGGSVTSNVHFEIKNWQNSPNLTFCIHNKACKKYIYSDGQYDSVFAKTLADAAGVAPVDTWTPQSGHFYWNLQLSRNLDVEKFFANFVAWETSECVQKLLDCINNL